MKELDLIRAFYGDRCAERSKVPLINHIHQGLDILTAIGATDAAHRAFCLHPLFQADDNLQANVHLVHTECLDPWAVMLAMEYRNQANAWLSDKVENHSVYSYSDPEPRLVRADYRAIGLPTPGPLPEVRDMLVADKVQNRKDFITHHRGTHPRSAELDLYFDTWLKALQIDEAMYQHLCAVIDKAAS